MSYFRNFPRTLYQFGDEEDFTLFNNIGVYADVIDQVKDNVTVYNKYSILEGDRPDNVSQKLYNNSNLYWTFYIMNDHLREQGWPLTNREVNLKAQKDFPNFTLVTTEDISSKFDIGQTVSGLTSGSTGVVVDKRLDFGQIIVDTNDTFLSTEIISSVGDNGLETATLTAAVVQYNSVHHYEDADGNYVDVDPFTGSVGNNLPVTYLEYYVVQNESLKEIRVIKPQLINQVNRSFNKSLRL